MQVRPTIRKLRADSPEAGRYGKDIARAGTCGLPMTVDRQVCVSALADGARRM